MQVCSCVRRRLWRQYGRDWLRLRDASPATLARAVSTSSTNTPAYHDSPYTNPTDLLDRRPGSGGQSTSSEAAQAWTDPRITFYKSANIRPTTRPWRAASDLDNPTAEELAAWSLVDWRFFVGGRARYGLPAEMPTKLFASQIHHLAKALTPEQGQELRRRFMWWKESVAVTWSMLRRRQLPCELDKDADRLLWRILEQEQMHASSDEAWLAGDQEGGPEGGHGRRERIRQLWGALTQDEREAQWPQLLLSTFRSYPELIADVFTATMETSSVPLYMLEDALAYIVRSNEMANAALKLSHDDLVGLLRLTIERGCLDAPLHLRQQTIYSFLRTTATPHDVSNLFDLLHGHGQPLHLNTLIQFASRLAKSPEYKAQAVGMVQLMVESHGLDINSIKGSALCTAILSSGWDRVTDNNAITPEAAPVEIMPASAADGQAAADGQGQQSLPTPAQLFEQLLGVGLEPNIITYTAIIRELCTKGELTSAQEVLQIMLNAQTGLDAYVYSILMNGAKLAGHYQLIRQVAEAAASNRVLHPYVWNDFLQAIHVMALAEVRSDPAYKRPRLIPAFPLMLDTYRKTFAPAPLLELLPTVRHMGHSAASAGIGMNSSVSSRRHWEFVAELGPTLSLLPQLSPEEAIEPTGVTLSTMVVGYIQGMSNPYDVIEFFSHFHRLVKMGHPVAVMIVEETGSMVYDVVIMALCEYDGMLRVALDVVSDMLRDASIGLDDQEPLPSQRKNTNKKTLDTDEQQAPAPAHDAADAADAHTNTPGVHSPPSVYTWSILLNGFMYHRHTMQSERILKMMTKRGIEPNSVTWNTLVAGYARLQFGRKTANALMRREMAGYEPDEFTFRAFSYLGDKATVIKYLERHRDAKKNAPGPSPDRQHRHPEIARRLLSLKQDVDEIAQTMPHDDSARTQ